MNATLPYQRPNPRPGPDRLGVLKRRLLRDWLARHQDGRLGRLSWLAAGEAEALAGQTPVPLLVLPTLLEEKLDAVHRYAARQRPSGDP